MYKLFGNIYIDTRDTSPRWDKIQRRHGWKHTGVCKIEFWNQVGRSWPSLNIIFFYIIYSFILEMM